MIARQTAALLLDAYRELNAKKMFWVTLVISGVVVAAFATVTINDRGWSVLGINVPSFVNTTLVPREMFYKLVFSNYAVGWWLNWLAIVLALISTAGIIPDFIAGGSVDLYLSKPVSRVRLFLTKYATGLLFVTLQVLIFSAACFVLIRIRAGTWDPRLFWAVPVVVLVFSYLFAFAVLLGLLTRSTVAALLLTILFWLGLFGVATAERLLFMGNTAGRIENDAFNNQLAYSDKELALLNQRIAGGDESARAALTAAQARRQELEERKHSTDSTRQNVATAHRILSAAKAILPKTADTNALLVRWLDVDDTELNEEDLRRREQRRAAAAASTNGGWLSGFRDRTRVQLNDPDVIRETMRRNGTLSAPRVIGTSLAFEFLTLALACWIFTRRDY
jgi:hypothetical protein